jgi:hypothetical protein
MLVLILGIGCLVLAAGCTSTPENPYKDIRKPFPTLDPNATPYVPGGNQISISDFPRFLAKWNDKMHWGFSPEQIENFSHSLENGVLKKYKTNPNYPSLEIPDLKPFCLEVGDAIGLSKKQSEVFAIAADEELIKDKIEFNKPLLPEPGAKALTEPGTQSAPFAYGNVDYECIFVNFTIPRPVKPGYQFSWTAADRSDVMNDFAIGTQAISNQAPQQASMSNLRYYWPVVTVDGINPGRGEESTSPNGWMENAIRNLGFEDLNGDGRVSDEFARYWKAYEGADSVVIVYFTHDAMGAYAAGAWWGYADKAVVSYWGYNGEFFDAIPGSYEHETVHIFGALDETLGSSTCGEYSIFAVSPMKEMYKNTNHENCAEWTNSVMRYYWLTNIISSSSKKFIGWGDFDTDGTLDPLDPIPWGLNSKIGVFRSSSGTWYLNYNFDDTSDNTFTYGGSGDLSVVGDWDGDEDTDIGYFRPTNPGYWYLDNHKDGTTDSYFQFGKTGDIPVVGDWNGNGYSDVGVFRPSNGNWYLDLYNQGGTPEFNFHFGTTGDIPVIGDWNSDGYTDIGVFRPANGNWYLDVTRTGTVWRTFHFGTTGDIPVVGSWDRDGDSDIGVFRPATGNWYLDTTKTGAIYRQFHFGTSGDIPVVGDWNSDVYSDVGVFRPANGNWYLDVTRTGAVWSTFHFGVNGDAPKVGRWI